MYISILSRISISFCRCISSHVISIFIWNIVYLESVDTSFKEVGCRVYRKSFLDEPLPFVLISARSLYPRHICVYR